MKEALVGFDSSWALKNHGAIVYAVFNGDDLEMSLPQLADFADASRIINGLKQECDDVLVAIDQPIIVPNLDASRPVDLVARSLMSRLRSAAQSASRNKESMFGDNAPGWGFISRIGPPQYAGRTTDLVENRAFVDFEAARNAADKTHLIEVYPALALPTLEPHFMDRNCAARYNPQRATFSLGDWQLVCNTVCRCADELGLPTLSQWAREMVEPWDSLERPEKRHQDKVDAALCLIIALQWRRQNNGVRVIGDLDNGYMVTPTSAETRGFIEAACNRLGVNFG